MKNLKRNTSGSVIVETALAIPVLLLLIFGLLELARILYVYNTLGVAAQKVASKISINARRSSTYDISGFSQFASDVRFPASVTDSSQFSFDVTNALNATTVANGQADGPSSTKVVVTVTYPPQGNNALRIPIFDPGNLVGRPIFGPNGLTITSSATCFLEKSRRPTLN